MRRSYISPEYQNRAVYGTLNMVEESTFFGAKMLEVEDTISIDNQDIIYYQRTSGEQLDISTETSLDSYIYSPGSNTGDKFKNHTLLVGHEGNSVLMHKWEWVKRLGKPVTKKDGYVTSCLDKIDWSINRNLEFDTISFIEPYSRSWNNPKEFGDVLSPISDIELIKLLPFVDILDADPNFFGDAELARSMIKDNVKDYLDTLIKSENENWVNFWNMGNINSNRLKEDTLKLDTHPRLNVNGIVYLRKVIEKAKTDGIIDVTALLSLKFNNYLVRNII